MDEIMAALAAGERDRAFALLRGYLKAHPQDANAWLAMSEAVSEPKQQLDALQRVLQLAPTHSRAASIRNRIERLKGTSSTPVPSVSVPPAPPEVARPATDVLSVEALVAEPPPPAAPPAPEPPVVAPPVVDLTRPAASVLDPAKDGAVAVSPPLVVSEDDSLDSASRADTPPVTPAAADEEEDLDELRRRLAQTPPDLAVSRYMREAPPRPAVTLPDEEEGNGIPAWVLLLIVGMLIVVGGAIYLIYSMTQ